MHVPERRFYRLVTNHADIPIDLMPKDWKFQSIYTRNPNKGGKKWEMATMKLGDILYVVKFFPRHDDAKDAAEYFYERALVIYKDMIGMIGVSNWSLHFDLVKEEDGNYHV